MAHYTQLCGNCAHLIGTGKLREWRCRMYPLKGEGAFKMLAYSMRDIGGWVDFFPTRHGKCKENNLFKEATREDGPSQST